MLDLDGSTGVADASELYRFVNPCSGKTVEDLPNNIPLWVTRAGGEQFPGLNESIDRFVSKAAARNLPITLVNHASAPHSFDLLDDTNATRQIIRQMLAFLRFHLLE
jgi:hypothetical protein